MKKGKRLLAALLVLVMSLALAAWEQIKKSLKEQKKKIQKN